MRKLKCITLPILYLVILPCFLLIGCGGGQDYIPQKRVSYEPPPIPECERRGFGYVKYINSSKYDISILSNNIHRGEELNKQRYLTVDKVPAGIYSCQYRYIGKRRAKIISKTFRVNICREVEVLLD